MTFRTKVQNIGIPDSEWEITTSDQISRAHLSDGRVMEIIQSAYESRTDEQTHENAVRKMRDHAFCRDMWNRINDPYYWF